MTHGPTIIGTFTLLATTRGDGRLLQFVSKLSKIMPQ
jgi:hypothetical protein